MADISIIPGSNLQICFVNEHHQTSETTDHETVR